MLRLIEYDDSLKRVEDYEAKVSMLLFVALDSGKEARVARVLVSAGEDRRGYKGENGGVGRTEYGESRKDRVWREQGGQRC